MPCALTAAVSCPIRREDLLQQRLDTEQEEDLSMDDFKPDLDKYPKLREMFAEYGEGELADLLRDARDDVPCSRGRNGKLVEGGMEPEYRNGARSRVNAACMDALEPPYLRNKFSHDAKR